MKAVMLARGRGTRMRQPDDGVRLSEGQARMAAAGLKALIPFRRPFLDYVLSALADAGCREICLIVGPEHPEIREYYVRISPPERVQVTFAIQPAPLGTASAVLAAERFTDGDPFLVLNADNYYPVDVCRALVELPGAGLPAFHALTLVRESNIDMARLGSYALLDVGPDGYLRDIIEKPDVGTMTAPAEDVFVSMNLWKFTSSVFAACRSVTPSLRGELELPEAVRYAVRVKRERFMTFPARAAVLDLSRRRDIPTVERALEGVDPRP